MYKVLNLEGPHQSILDGKTDCVDNLLERSAMALDPVCDRPKFGGTGLKLNGAMESTNEEYKGESTVQTTTRVRGQVDRHCLNCGHG